MCSGSGVVANFYGIVSFWGRAILIGCFEGTRRRFIESTELYLAAVHQQVEKRRTGVIPNLEDYILLRRDTGALKMCFAMGEFGLNLSIPDAVFENDLMKTMQDCANDVVVLSNVSSPCLFVSPQTYSPSSLTNDLGYLLLEYRAGSRRDV